MVLWKGTASAVPPEAVIWGFSPCGNRNFTLSVHYEIAFENWEPVTENFVRRTSLPLRLQLPRWIFPARGHGEYLRSTPHAGHGIARYRWRLRRAAVSSGCEKNGYQGAYWGGGDGIFITEAPFGFTQGRLRHGEKQSTINYQQSTI